MPNLPVSNAGYQTAGGNLVPIGDGVEKVVGNKHNDTKIDGVSGVQLIKNGEVDAEVEDKEVIADGDKVYSHRLKYNANESYADKMKKIVSKRNKLEKEQEASSNKRRKNTIERQLAGLNMAENALFEHQELKKYEEGIKVANSFAFGGKIKKFEGGGTIFTESTGKKYRLVNGKKQYFIDPTTNKIPTERGIVTGKQIGRAHV